jgi:hypothetical protein
LQEEQLADEALLQVEDEKLKKENEVDLESVGTLRCIKRPYFLNIVELKLKPTD